MFGWAILFLIVAIVAAALGFSAMAGMAAWAAKVVFVVALIFFVASVVMGLRRN